MERARLGDKEAFHALFAEIGPVVTRYLRRFVTNHAELEDICQEVLIAVYRSRHTYDSARPFEPWLFAIVRKVSVRHFRQHQRETALQVQAESIEEFRVENASALALDVRQALDRLPAPQVEALKLTKVLGLSIEEASERAGTTSGSMKVRVHRAYQSLKKALMR
jgi:RNA polymerase sigma factor (sigma-70 family)